MSVGFDLIHKLMQPGGLRQLMDCNKRMDLMRAVARAFVNTVFRIPDSPYDPGSVRDKAWKSGYEQGQKDVVNTFTAMWRWW